MTDSLESRDPGATSPPSSRTTWGSPHRPRSTRDTRFFADLGLASIDAVVLSEAIQEHYGRPLPFDELMAEIGRRTDRDLSIGELVAFLVSIFEQRTSLDGTLAMPKIHANGLNFHYQQAGEGPDVVLIHGVTGDLSIWFLCQAMGDARPVVPGDGVRPPRARLQRRAAVGLHLGRPGRRRAGDHGRPGDRPGHAGRPQLRRRDRDARGRPAIRTGSRRSCSPTRSFAALRHLEDLSRWGHWQNFREEAAQAGVTLSSTSTGTTSAGSSTRSCTSTASGSCSSARPSACPASIACSAWPGRPAATTPRPMAGLTEDLICGVTQPVLALFGELSPFLATADYLAEHLPHCVSRRVPGAKHRRPEENPEGFVELVVRVPDDGPAVGRGGEAESMNTKPTVLLTGAGHGIGRATAMALAARGTPLGLIDRDGPALAALAQELQDMGATVADAVADVTDRDALHRAVATIAAADRADRGPGRLRRHRHAHPGPRPRHARCSGRRSTSTCGRGAFDRGGPAGDDRAGAWPHRRRGQRGRLPRLPLDDLVLRLQGRADRLPGGPAARPATARRDGDHRLPRVRPDAAQHDGPLPAPGQDDRARGGRPPPRPGRRAPAEELRLPLGHADRPGHPEVHARPRSSTG